MQYLTITIGNTHIYCSGFRGDRLTGRLRLRTSQSQRIDFRRFCRRLRVSKEVTVLLCSVVPAAARTIKCSLIKQFPGKVFEAGKELKIPLKSRYKIKSQLGVDRLVGAYEAYGRYKKGVLVVGCGTAVTMDAISDKGLLLGGAIAPGSDAMVKALSLITAQIPFYGTLKQPGNNVFGRSTDECLRIGCFYGLCGLVDRITERMIDKMGNRPEIIYTGGGAAILERFCHFKGKIEPRLIEKGLIRAFQEQTCR